jgi:putative PIN family toxin of toxin-antitoxin system
MKIVCDSNVLVRAALNLNGLAAEVLRRIRAAHLLVASQPLLSELLVIMRRPKIQRLHGLDERGIRRFISALYKVSTIVHVPQPVPRIIPSDPKDDAIMLTAIGAKADALATRDQHFIHADVVALAASHGLRIVTDDQLLTEL